MAMQMEIDERPPHPLLNEELMVQASDDYLLKIIEETEDVNMRDNRQRTPLHLAVKRSSTAVLDRLIQKGANLHARRSMATTPLQDAEANFNFKAIYELLKSDLNVKGATIVCQYNSDISTTPDTDLQYMITKCKYGTRLETDSVPIIMIFTEEDHNTAFNRLATSPLQYIGYRTHDNGFSAITNSIRNVSPELFKIIWERVNYKLLFLTRKPFLLIYIESCRFSIDQKVECLYSILRTHVAVKLLRHTVDYFKYYFPGSFLSTFLVQMGWKEFPIQDVIHITHILLTLGIQVTYQDIEWAERAGLVEITSLLSYHSSTSPRELSPNLQFDTLITRFLVLADKKTDYEPKRICDLLLYQLRLGDIFKPDERKESKIETALGYFSLPRLYKPEVSAKLRELQFSSALTKLEDLPEFPTLLELCRNRLRHLLLPYGTQVPRKFFDAVKRLNVCETLQDIICFKKPVHARCLQ